MKIFFIQMILKNVAIIGVIVLLLVICCALLSGILYFWGNSTIIKSSTTDNSNKIAESTDSYDNYQPFAIDTSIPHSLTIKIISPEEETFIPRQARMYNALVEGNGKYSNLVKCNWKFYLNENNEEVLYQEMNNEGVLSGETKEMCGFTSTFIDKKGTLRVVVTMTVYDAVNDNLETVSAERSYMVI